MNTIYYYIDRWENFKVGEIKKMVLKILILAQKNFNFGPIYFEIGPSNFKNGTKV